MKPVATLLIGTLVLSACTVGPEYVAPEINAPPQFLSQDVLSTLNEGFSDQTVAADWWTGFGERSARRICKPGAGLRHARLAVYGAAVRSAAGYSGRF